MIYYRIKGFKIFRDRHGKMRCYHRASGDSVNLETHPLGSESFVAEITLIQNQHKALPAPRAGTLGLLIQDYLKSPDYQKLRPNTRNFYHYAFEFLKPMSSASLLKFTPPTVIKIRDKAEEKRGWYFANQVKTTLSTVFTWGMERDYITTNPARAIKKVKRPKDMARANRPWNETERTIVIKSAPDHIRPVLAVMLYTGIDPCDALALEKPKYKDGVFDLNRQKTGNPVWKPAPAVLKQIIGAMPKHDAITLLANSYGKPWTKSGFDASWKTFRNKLVDGGQIGKGLTLKGLRHTHATMLREQGEDNRTIADALGDKSEAMGKHYSRDADIRDNMERMVKTFDKNHLEFVKPSEKGVKP